MSSTSWPPQMIVTRLGRSSRRRSTSAYADVFWTPILGGTALATYRALTRIAAAAPGERVSLEDLAHLIGERSPDGPERAWRAIGTLDAEGVVSRTPPDEVEVPSDLPLLRADQAERLPMAVREIHPAWMTLAHIDDLQSAAIDGFVAVASFLDEALADRTCSPLRSLQRWQQAIRMSSDFHDDLTIDLAPPGGRSAVRQLGDRCRTLLDEVRRAQRTILTTDGLAAEGYRELQRAVGSVTEWIDAQKLLGDGSGSNDSPQDDLGALDGGGTDEPVA